MDLKFRDGTGDARIWKIVFDNNEYKIGDMTGKTVIDIGANIGAFGCLASQRGAKKIVCVEPFESNYKILCHNCGEFDNIIPLKYAISSKDNEKLRLCTEEEYRASFKKKLPDYPFIEMGGVHVDTAEGSSGSDLCETICLETIIERYNFEVVNLLKIDCEGGEWKVFSSITHKTFKIIDEIVGEYHLAPDTGRKILGNEINPIDWLAELFEKHGFVSFFKGNLCNKNVGWFYARKYNLEKRAINEAWFKTESK